MLAKVRRRSGGGFNAEVPDTMPPRFVFRDPRDGSEVHARLERPINASNGGPVAAIYEEETGPDDDGADVLVDRAATRGTLEDDLDTLEATVKALTPEQTRVPALVDLAQARATLEAARSQEIASSKIEVATRRLGTLTLWLVAATIVLAFATIALVIVTARS